MFPGITIKKPIDFSETLTQDIYSTPFEGGYVETRPKNSRAREQFSLAWTGGYSLSLQERNDLKQFFKEHQGESFIFTDPWTDEEYEVVFKSKALQFGTEIPGRYYNCSLELEEV